MVTISNNTKSASETHTDTASDEDSESRKSKGNSVQKGKMNKFAVRMARHMHMTGGSGSGEKSHHGSDAR